MVQLAMMTSQSGLSVNFRWPYQANVMKIFDIANRAMGRMDCGII